MKSNMRYMCHVLSGLDAGEVSRPWHPGLAICHSQLACLCLTTTIFVSHLKPLCIGLLGVVIRKLLYVSE